MLFPFSFMQSQGAAVDPDAAAFFARVTAAGGTLSATEQTAVNTLVLDMKAYGIWSSMKAVYPMVGASAAACAQNLKSSSFTGTFTSGWTFASTGATPNGTSAFLNSQLQPSTQLTGTSTHISYYSRTNTTTNAGVEMGTWVGSYAYGTEMALNRSGAGTYLRINSGSTGQTVISGQNSQAFFIGSRTADNLIKFYRNTSTLFTNTDTATINLSTFNTYIGASNDFGTAATFSTKECAFASIGDGLNDTQASNFYTAVQTFNTTLNRSVGTPIVSDADAQAYIDRVYTAGGTLTNTEANAVNQLTIDMKAAGIWTAMKAVYPMVGSSAAACAQNLKSSSFTGSFTSGWTFASTGVTPNGTSAYMDTMFNPNTQLSSNNGHLSYYSRTNDNIGSYPVEMGSESSVTTGVNLCVLMPLDNYKGRIGGNTSLSYANTNSSGFYVVSRTSSTNLIGHKNGVNQQTVSSTNTYAASNFNIYIGATNNSNTSQLFSTRESAFASIGDGLTDTQAADFYTCVQTFNTTLSRQV